MRVLVMVIGALIALVGLSQIVAAPWWLGVLPSIMDARNTLIFGVVAIVVGIILVVAVLQRAVAWRPFVLVLGLLMLLGGLALTLNPGTMRHILYMSVLSHPQKAQLAVTTVGGVIRAVIGLLLIYAAAIKREPRVSTNRPIVA